MKANLTTGLGRYRRFGLRNAFVVLQVAAAMMLVLIMGFFVIGARYGSKTEPGFDTAPLSFFSVDPARDGLTPRESADALRRIPERLAHVAGVESVSLADQPPLSSTFPDTAVSVPSLSTRAVAMQKVGPGFFTTLRATMLRGADFEDRDLLSEDGSGKILPAVINQTAAKELFGEADPLGRRFQQDQRTFEVTGVVRYAPRAMLMGRPIPMVLVPLTAKDLEGGATGGTTVVIRARTQIGIPVLRRELAAIDSRLTLFHPQTMPEYACGVGPRRFGDCRSLFPHRPVRPDSGLSRPGRRYSTDRAAQKERNWNPHSAGCAAIAGLALGDEGGRRDGGNRRGARICRRFRVRPRPVRSICPDGAAHWPGGLEPGSHRWRSVVPDCGGGDRVLCARAPIREHRSTGRFAGGVGCTCSNSAMFQNDFPAILAVDNVSFQAHAGEITGYLGPNGSGKSTTMKMITGLIETTSGKIFFDGQPIRSDLLGFKQRMGYVPEEPHLYSHLSGLEYLIMVGQLRELPARPTAERIDGLLRLLSLHSDRHAPISSYSKGMRQKVLLSAAAASQSRPYPAGRTILRAGRFHLAGIARA